MDRKLLYTCSIFMLFTLSSLCQALPLIEIGPRNDGIASAKSVALPDKMLFCLTTCFEFDGVSGGYEVAAAGADRASVPKLRYSVVSFAAESVVLRYTAPKGGTAEISGNIAPDGEHLNPCQFKAIGIANNFHGNCQLTWGDSVGNAHPVAQDDNPARFCNLDVNALFVDSNIAYRNGLNKLAAKNFELAFCWFAIAAAREDYPKGLVAFGWALETGLGGGAEPNAKKSFQAYLAAANKEDSNAEFLVIRDYLNSRGTSADEQESRRWASKLRQIPEGRQMLETAGYQDGHALTGWKAALPLLHEIPSQANGIDIPLGEAKAREFVNTPQPNPTNAAQDRGQKSGPSRSLPTQMRFCATNCFVLKWTGNGYEATNVKTPDWTGPKTQFKVESFSSDSVLLERQEPNGRQGRVTGTIAADRLHVENCEFRWEGDTASPCQFSWSTPFGVARSASDAALTPKPAVTNSQQQTSSRAQGKQQAVISEDPNPQRLSHALSVPQAIMEKQCVTKVSPDFPGFTRNARISGDVYLRVLISKTGTVTPLGVDGGNVMLHDNAKAAVKKWKYKPYLVHGQAVDVETSVTVVFDLNVADSEVTHPQVAD
jgi:TonB family protein